MATFKCEGEMAGLDILQLSTLGMAHSGSPESILNYGSELKEQFRIYFVVSEGSDLSVKEEWLIWALCSSSHLESRVQNLREVPRNVERDMKNNSGQIWTALDSVMNRNGQMGRLNLPRKLQNSQHNTSTFSKDDKQV